jgi:2-polyprenyl-6-methoxyphenol hydroxylase-like FAD-dependent oxidoreductase
LLRSAVEVPVVDSGFDVIIVGGRPAGASLAARLGQRGRRVLVVERADLPSVPTVPSCPTLHMGTLALLDELGVPESAYGPDALRFDRFVVQFASWFTARMTMPTVAGRAYGYSIYRSRFDLALWNNLDRYPTVTRRRFAVSGLVRDDAGTVVGIEGSSPGVDPERILAPWVVGADGRFSLVAREAGAPIVEESAEKVSTVYFTDWEGLAPLDPKAGPPVQIYTTGRGLNVLLFPLPEGRTTICVHQRADRVDIAGDAEGFYQKTIRGIPALAARLAEARPVGKVIGLKRVGNGYRQAAGAGWALVGDAFHYKDPVDGQGIYDALLGTRILAEELEANLAGAKDAAAAGAAYATRARDATRPMYLATVKRLAEELYSEPPVPVIRTLIRWLLTDPVYQERFILFLARGLDPARWAPPSLVLGCVVRGIGRDVAGLFRRAPAALPVPE